MVSFLVSWVMLRGFGLDQSPPADWNIFRRSTRGCRGVPACGLSWALPAWALPAWALPAWAI